MLWLWCILLLWWKTLQDLWAPGYDTNKTRIQWVSGGHHAVLGNLCGVWIGWTQVMAWKRNKGPQQSPACFWTPASNTYQQSKEGSNQYWLILCPGGIRYSQPWRWNKKRQDRAQKEIQKVRQQWSTFNGQTLHSCLPPIHNADVLSIRDLFLLNPAVRLINCRASAKIMCLFQSLYIAFNIQNYKG